MPVTQEQYRQLNELARTMPALRAWLDQSVIQFGDFLQGISTDVEGLKGGGSIALLARDITPGSPLTELVGTIPAGRYTNNVQVEVTEEFDDPTATLSVGTATEAESLIEIDKVDLSEKFIYQIPGLLQYNQSTPLYYFFSKAGSTQGNAKIRMTIV